MSETSGAIFRMTRFFRVKQVLKLIAILVISFSCPFLARGASLDCSQEVNYAKSRFTHVLTTKQQKTSLFSDTLSSVFVSEKENEFFEIEAFIVENELRIYGSGHLKAPEDKIQLSIWSRDSIINWECFLSK